MFVRSIVPSQQLRSFDNKLLMEPDGQTPIRVREIACQALLAQVPGDQPSELEKLRRFWLAQRIGEPSAEDTEITLNEDDDARLLGCVGRCYNTLLWGAFATAVGHRPT